MSSRAMRVAIPLWAIVVLLTALPPLASGYVSLWALLVLAASVAIPFGIVALGRLCRVPRWAIATVALILGVVAALTFAGQVDQSAGALPAWRSSPGFGALGPLIDAVPRLLTAPRPAPMEAGLLVPAALLTWIVATAVALAAIGSRGAPTAPLLGAVALHVAGALLTAGRGDLLGTSALATAVVLLLGWVLLPGRQRAGAAPTAAPGGAAPGTSRARSHDRRTALVPALVVLVVASFALTATVVSTAHAFEPRTLVPPPQLPADAANPVPEMAVWSQRGDVVVFTVTAVDGPLPERLALTTLPDFDGAAWRVDAELRAMGVVDTPDTPLGAATRVATYEVTPGELPGVWVPSAGQATQVEGAHVLMDLDTGTIVAPSGWSEPLVITTTLNAPSPEAIGRASVPQAAGYERYLDLPRVPTWFGAATEIATSGVSSRWEQVSRIADAVRHDSSREGATGAERLLDDGGRSGSSYARLQQFLLDAPEDGGQVGTSEQFAAAFAVLARSAGIPTRIVAGFEVPGAGTETTVEVTGADARVWAEVYLARVGWVAVDPGPDSSTSTELPTPQPQDETGDEPDPTPQDEQTQQPATTGDEDEPGPAQSLTARTIALVLGAVGVLGVLGLIALALTRLSRRASWRGSGDRGAWAQIEDSMRLAGLEVPAEATATTLAATLPEPVTAAAVTVAERAEAHAFAPAEAASSSRDPGDADSWDLGRRVERELRSHARLGPTLAWYVSPRVWRR